MKKVFFVFAFGALLACSENKESTTEVTESTAVKQVAETKHYACPMHCEGEKTYAEPGKCSVCTMDLKEVALAEADSTQVP